MPAPSPLPDFRDDINALRALAVLAVIAFHFDVPGARAGFLGVDVFFVISGFLIGGLIQSRLDRGSFTLAGFFAGRIRRIVPALAALCVAVLAWGAFYQLPDDYKALGRSVQSTILFYSNASFAKQLGYFDLGAAYKPLLHTWSLSIEAQFYLLLPLFMIVLARLPRRARLPAIALAALASFAAALYLGRGRDSAVFFSFWARAWEFLVGCAAAQLVRGNDSPWRGPEPLRRAVLAGCWAALAASCFLMPTGTPWPGPWTLLPTLLTAALIVLGTGRQAGPLVGSGPAQHLGRISYSLYLWHWPVLVCSRLTLGERAAQGAGLPALLGATWLLAWLSWRFVEQPVRTHGALRANRRMYQLYGALIAAFAAATVFVVRTDGWPARLPAYLEGAALAARNSEKLEQCWHLPGAIPGELPYACDIGDPRKTPPTFAVWGDSHALQYLGALRSAAGRRSESGWLFHRPGCEPHGSDTPGEPACAAHNAQVLRLLQATPSVTTVLIAIRQNNAERVDRSWAAARLLADRHYRVVFAGPLPEAHWAVAQEWARLQLLLREPMRDMTIARAEPTRVAPFDQRLGHWRGGQPGAPGVTAIDLSDLFCDSARCWLVRDGVGLFRDADHLTTAAAERAIPRIYEAIRPAAR